MGVEQKTRQVVLAALTKDQVHQDLLQSAEQALNARQDDSVIEILSKRKTSELMKAYEISKNEFAAARLPNEDGTSVLKRLIVERVALLAVEK